MPRNLDPRVVQALETGRMENGCFHLPPLDRSLYVEADKALKGIGGKWDRKAGGHRFALGDPMPLIERLLGGERVNVVQDIQFFESPAAVIHRLIDLAGLRSGMSALEPSAGTGAIAKGLRAAVGEAGRVDVCDIHPPFQEILIRLGFDTWPMDFLKVDPEERVEGGYDAVVMNPPFAKGQDVLHVRHAYQFLRPGGVLVSVMPIGWQQHEAQQSVEFRAWVSGLEGEVFPLPEGSFRASGTEVSTLILRVTKPEGRDVA